jgi:hypothetical protein
MDTASGPRAVYEIQLQGELDQGWEQWFDGLAVTFTAADDKQPTTTLLGPVVDQAALRGLLCKLWDLNLILVSVRRLETDRQEEYDDE